MVAGCTLVAQAGFRVRCESQELATPGLKVKRRPNPNTAPLAQWRTMAEGWQHGRGAHVSAEQGWGRSGQGKRTCKPMMVDPIPTTLMITPDVIDCSTCTGFRVQVLGLGSNPRRARLNPAAGGRRPPPRAAGAARSGCGKVRRPGRLPGSGPEPAPGSPLRS